MVKVPGKSIRMALDKKNEGVIRPPWLKGEIFSGCARAERTSVTFTKIKKTPRWIQRSVV